MDKTPSDNEGLADETRDNDATGKMHRVRPRQRTVPYQAPEKPRREFYADEHPEIPRIRRASLNKNREEQPAATDLESPTSHSKTAPYTLNKLKQARKETPPFTGLDEEKVPPTRSGSTSTYTRLVRQQGHREMLPFTGLEETSRSETGAHEKLGSQTRSIRRYNPVTPDPVRQPTGRQVVARRQEYRSGRVRWPFWQSKRNWILFGLLALVILLIAIPTLLNSHQNTTQQNSSTNGGQGVSLSKLQSVPANPHELVIQPATNSHPAPPVEATSAYLLDANTAATYYAQNPFLHLPMLSTTKLMTAALAVEKGNLDQQITITAAMEHDIKQLSADSALFGVKQGETYSLRDLLYGLLFVSGNDAALVIADALAGNEQNFVAEMNQKAQVLGLHDTHFVNPHGLLDPGQYSCARDLAVLGLYSLSIPTIQQISSQKTYHISAAGKHGARVLLNENQFLWWYPGVDAGKTGYDGESDFVQVMLVTRNNHTMVGVVMHTNDWWTDMRDLMDYGSNDYSWISPRDVDASGQPVPYDNLWNYFAKDTPKVTLPTANGGQYFVYTGFSVSGPILTYFNKQGGLSKFGYPIKLSGLSGSTTISQQFQNGTIQCDFSTNQCRTA